MLRVAILEDEQTVDLHIRVRDVWSLNPGFSFSRKGGKNGAGIEIEEQDFMGRGELVSLEWGSDVDRTSLRVVYDDPQLLGTWWRGRVSHADNSDGSTSANWPSGGRFDPLDTRWSAGTDLSFGDRSVARYREGLVLDEFDEHVDRFQISGGRSRGLEDGWTAAGSPECATTRALSRLHSNTNNERRQRIAVKP